VLRVQSKIIDLPEWLGARVELKSQLEDAYGCNLDGLKDRDGDGFPDLRVPLSPKK